MPKYTITTDNGEGVQRTDEPLEFPDTKAATDDAQIALAEMAREGMPDGKEAHFRGGGSRTRPASRSTGAKLDSTPTPRTRSQTSPARPRRRTSPTISTRVLASERRGRT
jgi:hypothetical protein